MTKSVYAILLIALPGISATAQEVLTTPSYNPVVARQFIETKEIDKATSSAITLPFYDDFSVISVYPSPIRWMDAYAFVNTDYAKFSPSVGVATFDALDETGVLYPNAGPNPFDADYLTSQPIRLDSLFTPVQRAINRNDNVLLSFYYQPQGRSISPPSKKASLILEFHSPGDENLSITGDDTVTEPVWREIWSTMGGIAIDSFAKPDEHYFRQVLIPINSFADSVLYYKNGFQFRFRNIATLAGNSQPDWRSNGSHWNIDIVWLNTGIITMKDVAFGDKAPSMLRDYEAMPYSQYRQNFLNELKDTLDIKISNLDNEISNKIYKYEVRKNSIATPIAEPYNGGTGNIEPFSTNGYTDWLPFSRPPVNFFFPISNEEKVVFHIIHKLTPDQNPIFQSNDTIQFDQMFSNYYAYDNGTSEAGVGINGASGSYAVKFKLNQSDTMRGIQFYFNPTINVNQELIDINVWNDAFGIPGQIIKTLNNVPPGYSNDLNAFYTYWFEEPLIIDPVTFPGLNFYTGWTQYTVNNLNVGFDRYTDSHQKRFFNVSGNWVGSDSINYGSVMMRPVIGKVNPLNIDKPAEVGKLSFRPNPVTDGKLIIKLPEGWKNIPENKLNIKIISASGTQVLDGSFINPVHVDALSPGFYIVIITDSQTGLICSGKVIVK